MSYLSTRFQQAQCGLFYVFIILFHLKAPFVIEHTLGQSAIVYGHIALMMGGGWFVGNILAKQSGRFPFLQKTNVLLLLPLIMLLVMTLINNFILTKSWLMSMPIIGCTFIVGLFFPQLTGKALAFFPKLGGGANACYFAGVWIISAVIAGIYSPISMTTPFSLTIGYIVLSIITLVCFTFLLKPRLRVKKH